MCYLYRFIVGDDAHIIPFKLAVNWRVDVGIDPYEFIGDNMNKLLIVRESQRNFQKTIDKWKKCHIIVNVSTRCKRVLKTKRGDKNRVNSKKTSCFKGYR